MHDSAPELSETVTLRKPLTDDQRSCVDLLKETLAVALEGRIHTIGIVACMDAGYAHVMAGTQAANLNLGCDSLKHAIRSEIEGGNVKRAKSNIIKVR
jgi:hypothetical protein